MEIQRSVDSKVETSRRNNLAACQSTFPLKKVPDRKSFSVYPAAITRAILTKPPPSWGEGSGVPALVGRVSIASRRGWNESLCLIRKHCNCLEYYIRYAVADEDGRSRCAAAEGRPEGGWLEQRGTIAPPSGNASRNNNLFLVF